MSFVQHAPKIELCADVQLMHRHLLATCGALLSHIVILCNKFTRTILELSLVNKCLCKKLRLRLWCMHIVKVLAQNLRSESLLSTSIWSGLHHSTSLIYSYGWLRLIARIHYYVFELFLSLSLGHDDPAALAIALWATSPQLPTDISSEIVRLEMSNSLKGASNLSISSDQGMPC